MTVADCQQYSTNTIKGAISQQENMMYGFMYRKAYWYTVQKQKERQFTGNMENKAK